MARILIGILFTLLPYIGLQAQNLNATLKGHLAYPPDEQLANVWGYAANGREYALVGTELGTSIVDVTDPTQPTELFSIESTPSIWRELKTWQHYCYSVTEGGGGVTIINLAQLPDAVTYTTWQGGDFNGQHIDIQTVHANFIDEYGILYLSGSNHNLILADLNTNPENPTIVGIYSNAYVHDLYAHNHIMYTGEIYAGRFAVVDVNNPANPIVLAQQPTPYAFTHNTWLDDTGNYLFTTDEKSSAYVAAYDISDLSDIKEIDRYRTSDSGVIPHNTHYINGFLVTSYYKDGVTIVDASYPYNLVETGKYDTSPLSGGGFAGAWGVYPYLPSGNLLVSDMQEGLFVIEPNYVKACHLIGNITSTESGAALPNVDLQITNTTTGDTIPATTYFAGNYTAAALEAGSYQIIANAYGYAADTIIVTLTNGQVITQDIALQPLPAFTFLVRTVDIYGQPIPNVYVSTTNAHISQNAISNSEGIAQFTLYYPELQNLVVGGKWGYLPQYELQTIANPNTPPYEVVLTKGYYDDFNFSLGWQISGDAQAGMWKREIPHGTFLGINPLNPDADADSDYGDYAFITGNSTTDDYYDIDSGKTVITSPIFDLTAMTAPQISYQRWFFAGTNSYDTLYIKLTNGADTLLLEQVYNNDPYESIWKPTTIDNLQNRLTLTNQMRLIVEVSDKGINNYINAGFDVFSATDAALQPPTPTIQANTFAGCAPLSLSFSDAQIGSPTAFTWTFSGGDTPPITTHIAQPTFTFAHAGTYTVFLSTANSAGIGQTDAVTISVFPRPELPTFDNINECAENIPTLTLPDNLGNTYTWLNSQSEIVEQGATFIPALADTYTAWATSPEGCTNSTSFEVAIQQPVATITTPLGEAITEPISLPICYTDSISVWMPNLQSVQWQGVGVDPNTAHQPTTTLLPLDMVSPDAAAWVGDTLIYQAFTTDNMGCTAIADLEVIVQECPVSVNSVPGFNTTALACSPNPAFVYTDILLPKLSNVDLPAMLVLYNVNGQAIWKSEVSPTMISEGRYRLSLANYPSGQYYISLIAPSRFYQTTCIKP